MKPFWEKAPYNIRKWFIFFIEDLLDRYSYHMLADKLYKNAYDKLWIK
jgi:hypothetical protein